MHTLTLKCPRLGGGGGQFDPTKVFPTLVLSTGHENFSNCVDTNYMMSSLIIYA